MIIISLLSGRGAYFHVRLTRALSRTFMDGAVLMWLEVNLIEGEDFLLVNNLDY